MENKFDLFRWNGNPRESVEWVRRRAEEMAVPVEILTSHEFVRTEHLRGGKETTLVLLPFTFLPPQLREAREREREGSKRGSIETKSGKRWREREKYPGEFISRRDYQTGADTRIPSSHNSRPSRRRGCVYIYIYVLSR